MYKQKGPLSIRPILCIEGDNKVGKTYLIDKIKDHFQLYKFPFNEYYKEFYSPDETDIHRKDAALFHLIAGSDVTLLDMHKKGILQGVYLFDRMFMSNIVFGVLSKRITKGRAIEYLNHLHNEGYLDQCHIIYIDADLDGSNKKVKELYEYFFNYMETNLNYKLLTRFTNKFSSECYKEFYKTLYNILKADSIII